MVSVFLFAFSLLAAEPGTQFVPLLRSPPPETRAGDSTAKAPTYRLKPDRKTRSYVFDGPAFRARVLGDGSVEFHNKRGTVTKLLFPFLPTPLPEGTPSVQSAITDLLGKNRPRRAPAAKAVGFEPGPVMPRMSQNRPDPSDECVYPRPCFIEWQPMLVAATGRFDLTDEIMRMLGDDPYAQEKARFLKATEEFRGVFAANNRAEDVKAALLQLLKRLRATWNDAGLTLAVKRSSIGEMRADLDLRLEESRRAAALIDAFLREYDPPASPAPLDR